MAFRSVRVSAPQTVNRPSLGSNNPAKSRIRVVLPAASGPTRPVTRPDKMRASRRSMAGGASGLNRLDSPSATISGSSLMERSLGFARGPRIRLGGGDGDRVADVRIGDDRYGRHNGMRLLRIKVGVSRRGERVKYGDGAGNRTCRDEHPRKAERLSAGISHVDQHSQQRRRECRSQFGETQNERRAAAAILYGKPSGANRHHRGKEQRVAESANDGRQDEQPIRRDRQKQQLTRGEPRQPPQHHLVPSKRRSPIAEQPPAAERRQRIRKKEEGDAAQ